MIETIKTGVDITCGVIQFGFYTSYKIGHFLVNIISFFQKVFLKLIYFLFEVFGVVFESFTTFFQDVTQHFQSIIRTLSSVDVIIYLRDIRNIFHSVLFLLVILCDFVVNMILTVIYVVLFSPKYLFIYLYKNIGSITVFTKDGLYDLTKFCIDTIQCFSQKTRDVLITFILFWINLPKGIYDLVTEVPFESLLCITVSCCLMYLFVRFYVIVLSFFYRHLKIMFLIIKRRFIQFGRHFSQTSATGRMVYRRQILPNRRPNIRPVRRSPKVSKNTENDRYCVVCQEHIKCILLLPCRHLCMCSECVNTLQLYNNTCPICRSNIETTMQIFV